MCFLEGSLVLLKRGYIPIEEIREDDEIIVYAELNSTMGFEFYNEPKYERVYFLGKTLTNLCGMYYFKTNTVGDNTDFYATEGTRILKENRTYNFPREFEEAVKIKENKKVYVYHTALKKHYMIKVNGILTESMIPKDIHIMTPVYAKMKEPFLLEQNTKIKILRKDELIETTVSELKIGDELKIDKFVNNAKEIVEGNSYCNESCYSGVYKVVEEKGKNKIVVGMFKTEYSKWLDLDNIRILNKLLNLKNDEFERNIEEEMATRGIEEGAKKIFKVQIINRIKRIKQQNISEEDMIKNVEMFKPINIYRYYNPDGILSQDFIEEICENSK